MLGSSIVVTVLSLLCTVISFVNQLVIAKLFGASLNMDAYLSAVSIPVMVSGTLSAVLSFSMVPALISHKKNQESYAAFSGLILVCLITGSVLLALAGNGLAHLLISIQSGSLPQRLLDEAVLMHRISWWSGAFSLVAGFLGAMHNASKRFILPVLSGIIPFICMIIAGVFFGKLLGPLAVVWGMFVGAGITVVILYIQCSPEISINPNCLKLKSEAFKYFLRAPLVMLAMFCFTVYQSIDSYWAPMIGPGNLSYLGYCQRLLIALGNLVIAGPSVVLVPRLAEAFLEGRHADFLNDTGRVLRTVIVFAAPLALVVSLLATPLVELIFQRGAFDQEATRGVVSVLPLMMAGMVAMLCVVMSFRALFARNDIISASFLGGGSVLLYFILSGILSRYFGVQGIAWAYLVTWWSIFILTLFVIWRDNVSSLFTRKSMICIAQLLSVLVVTGLITFCTASLFIRPLQEIGYGSAFVRIVFTTSSAALGFFFIAIVVLKINEVIFIKNYFTEKFKSIRHTGM